MGDFTTWPVSAGASAGVAAGVGAAATGAPTTGVAATAGWATTIGAAMATGPPTGPFDDPNFAFGLGDFQFRDIGLGDQVDQSFEFSKIHIKCGQKQLTAG